MDIVTTFTPSPVEPVEPMANEILVTLPTISSLRDGCKGMKYSSNLIILQGVFDYGTEVQIDMTAS